MLRLSRGGRLLKELDAGVGRVAFTPAKASVTTPMASGFGEIPSLPTVFQARSFCDKAEEKKPSKKAEEDDDDVDEDEEPEPEKKDGAAAEAKPFLLETEKVTGPPVKHEFQAETRKLLDIVARSLYTDKEVFVRELISNASDALEKLRHNQVTGLAIADPEQKLEIQIATDEKARTLTIQDFGIGMTQDELVNNLGNIGHSGSLEFVQKVKSSKDIIGQFGVGFYSTFMVGNKVKVYSRSATPGAKGYLWISDGCGTYDISEAEGVARGTKIIIELKEESKEFSHAEEIEGIIQKYSNFVGFDISLNGKKVNTVKALWTLNKNDITEDDHKQFYQFIARAYDSPKYTLHFTTDSPISIKSIFYMPETHFEKYGMQRMEGGISLFSRKVLIQSKVKNLLPDWLRFVKGVVDSEDVPLNLSREHLQDSNLIQKLGNILTKRLLKFLDDESKKDADKYNKFFTEFATFFKEGACTDLKFKEDVAKLLRFESSKESEGKLVSFEDYVARMPAEQKDIYYLSAPSRSFAETSPYFESFKERGTEVLFLFTNLDDFVMNNLGDYKGKKLISAESAKLDPLAKKEAPGKLTTDQVNELTNWMKDTLASKVSVVRETDRLTTSPAVIVDHEAASLRRMMKFVDPNRSAAHLPKQQLEINTSHPIITKLYTIHKANTKLAASVAEQIFDNALIAAGLLDDSRAMLPRIHSLLEMVLQNAPVAPSAEPAAVPAAETPAAETPAAQPATPTETTTEQKTQ